jgi:hypothetical protein
MPIHSRLGRCASEGQLGPLDAQPANHRFIELRQRAARADEKQVAGARVVPGCLEPRTDIGIEGKGMSEAKGEKPARIAPVTACCGPFAAAEDVRATKATKT